MKKFNSGSYFEKISGYSRIVGDDKWVISAGTTGFDYEKMIISDSLEKQVERTIENIKVYLSEFNVTLDDVILCNWVVTKREYYEIAAKILNNVFSDVRPVMMTLVCDLVDERMKFEMQVFAKRK